MTATRVSIVTGAAAGLGRAISESLAERGDTVVAVDRRSSADTAAAVEAAGGRVVPVVADVIDGAAVEALFETAAGITGRIDAVVNNAGRFGGSTLLDTDDAQWDEYLDINLRSAFVMTRAAVRRMLDQDERDGVRGRIVNMASQLGIAAPPAALGYSVAKAGVIQLTRQVAVDYGPRGILVNALAPGRIITGDHAGESDYLATGAIDEATRFSLSRTPFSRLGRPSDVAGAAAFLTSDDCAFVSGAVLSVDGGWTAS